jgi:hypothetical protein
VPFKSKSQQRWMFAAEARGEVPKGTAKRWANETPNITKLPEKKMEKKAMFFEDQEPVEDGMFMKRAEELKLPKTEKPKPPKLETPPPERQHTTTEEAVKGTKPQPGTKKPQPALAMMGTGGKKCAMLGIPKDAQMNMGMTPPQGGAMNVSAGSTGGMAQAGAQPGAQMGTGGKSKKKTSVKKEASAEDVARGAGEAAVKAGKRLGQTGEALWRGTKATAAKAPEKVEEALKYIENLPPAAQAALVGGTGYVAAKKIGKGVARAAGRAKPSALQRLAKGLRRLRGR